MLRCYTDVILKRKQVICQRSWLTVLHLNLNFYEYEMLIERELSYISLLFLNNRQQPASD